MKRKIAVFLLDCAAMTAWKFLSKLDEAAK